jgi:hypothetical protein
MNWTLEQYQDYIKALQTKPTHPFFEPYAVTKKALPKGPNKWELAYIREELEPRRLVGEISWYGFECIKLKLAGATFYTPDFAVLRDGRLSFVEVKGFLRDDAGVKFKVAAAQFPCFRFTMLRKKKVSDGGGWEVMKVINA